MEEKKEITPTRALINYMESGKHGRKLGLQEVKQLTEEERLELGKLAIEATEKGWE